MREIKFKAKRKDNGEWVCGLLCYDTVGMLSIQDEDYGSGNCYEVIPETICQYTGLKDKNGVKIFEGDILREYSNEIEDWIVSYDYGKFVGTFDNICEDLYELSYLEIIGNIFEEENTNANINGEQNLTKNTMF